MKSQSARVSQGGEKSPVPRFDIGSFATRHGGVTQLKINSGAALYRQGQPAECLFYIQSGRATLSVVSQSGREAIIMVLNPGDLAGESCLVGELTHLTTARCIANSTVMRVERSNAVRAIQDDARFAEFCVFYSIDRSARLRDRLISQFFDSSEQRLARLLLLLAPHREERSKEHVVGNLDQEALAQMTGTTRSRVNHFMNKFRRLGFIDYNGHITVRSSLMSVLTNRPRAS